jgi:ribosomal protein L19
MKINPILYKLELPKILSKAKSQFHSRVSRGDIVSIIYYDLDKEQVRLQQFTGICIQFKSRGLNTKIMVSNIVSKVAVTQQFFLYSKTVLDIAILRKKNQL